MRFNVTMLGALAALAMLLIAPAAAAETRPVLVVSDYKVAPGASIATTAPGPLMPGDAGTVVVTITNTVKSPMQGNTSTSTETYNFYNTGSQRQSPDIVNSRSTQTSDTTQGCSDITAVTLGGAGPVSVTSDNYVNPGCLGLGDSGRFEFSIRVAADAADGKYYLPFHVRTDSGDVFVNLEIPVVVDSSPVRMILNDAPTALGTAKATVTLDVVNLRPIGVTAVSVIPAGDEFLFRPRQEYTVGNIGAGEMYTVSFDINSRNNTYNGSPSFVVKYKNGDNWHQSAPVTLHLDASTAASASSPAVGGGQGILYLIGAIVVLAVLVGGAFLYMRGQRAKK